ncbi:hypothetical protein KBZ18_07705 [Synechococcus sp. Cruz-9H2]|nr:MULTISPECIES: hypothetical protein [unclassified Synechococcus]MCP9819376.1 hypothetical protein [Synechococcus sp. Cruz-9H2]MCP9843169.1 hypothetical protein [Synechococcus sp. Edmonson 11F2]MCP9854914.1 hypothetical protein [Synechococcus sp. Cruz-9C9]MCP9862615.1 hypothetical protein [Synechococcus sp. Cruz-7E5]MCP9870286.1 hypothetical protein [Synechococcus sp. Cruz-7B9]
MALRCASEFPPSPELARPLEQKQVVPPPLESFSKQELSELVRQLLGE